MDHGFTLITVFIIVTSLAPTRASLWAPPCPDCVCAIEARQHDVASNKFPDGFERVFKKEFLDCEKKNPHCHCKESHVSKECTLKIGIVKAQPGHKVSKNHIILIKQTTHIF